MAPKDEEKAVKIAVTTEKDKPKQEGSNKNANKKSDDDDTPTMSEEDKELKERLETCVSTLLNEQSEESVTVPIRLKALDVIVTELRSSTSTMTSVPKPLKFLRPHFSVLRKLHSTLSDDSAVVKDNDYLMLRARLADVLSVLAMTMGNEEDRESLKFKLSGMKDYDILKSNGANLGDGDNLGSWGHEYARSLAGEIGQEYNSRVLAGADPDTDEPFTDLLGMVDVIVPFHMSHNAEAEAVDLLIEVQRLSKLKDLDSIDETNYSRICLYLIKTADYMSDPDDLSVSFHILYY